MALSPFPSFPISQITIPSSPLIDAADAYLKQHTTQCTANHCLRSTAFSLILLRKFAPLVSQASNIDTEVVTLSVLLHDMGWATTKSLVSNDKRFEVDGANIARSFVHETGPKETWDQHRVQLLWDAIALHATPSIAQHKQPEVLAAHLGILADFLGPNIPLPGAPISVEEYKEVVSLFPRLDFKNELREIFCGMCREKPETTFDNFVSEYGRLYGLDGKGKNRDKWIEQCQARSFVGMMEGGLTACEQWE